MPVARSLRHAFPLVAFAAVMATFYPGHMSFDSSIMLWQARTGEYYNVSPSIVPIVWGVVHSVWPASGGLFTLQMFLFIGGTWATCCGMFSLAWKRIAASLYVLVGTPALLVVTHLWTDALVIACLAAGCGLTFVADRFRSRTSLAAALPLILLGGMVRHNAAPALLPLLVWWMLVMYRLREREAVPRARWLILAAFAGVLGITAVNRLIDHVAVKHHVSTFAAVQVFDLAAISVSADEMLVPGFLLPPGFSVEKLRWRYVPYNNVPLFMPPDAVKEVLWDGSLSDQELRALREAWRNAIVGHPLAYLRHRLAVASWLFDRYRNDRPIQLAMVEEWGPFGDNPVVRANDTPMHRWAIAWYQRAIGWWVFAPITSIVVAIVLLFVNLRARATLLGQAALAIASSGLAYVALLPLVVPSGELRYSGWMFAATSLALVATIERVAASRATRARKPDGTSDGGHPSLEDPAPVAMVWRP